METAINREADCCAEELHPLSDFLLFYYRGFGEIQRKVLEDEDLDSLMFQKQYGLSVSSPVHWNAVSSVGPLIHAAISDKADNIVVIYPSTIVYRQIANMVENMTYLRHDVTDCVSYFAWQEMYVAMDRAGKDIMGIQKFRNMLQNADLVLFWGAPTGIPEILDQVRGFCEGCLIILE